MSSYPYSYYPYISSQLSYLELWNTKCQVICKEIRRCKSCTHWQQREGACCQETAGSCVSKAVRLLTVFSKRMRDLCRLNFVHHSLTITREQMSIGSQNCLMVMPSISKMKRMSLLWCEVWVWDMVFLKILFCLPWKWMLRALVVVTGKQKLFLS